MQSGEFPAGSWILLGQVVSLRRVPATLATVEHESLNRDLNDTVCSVETCLQIADVLGRAQVRLPPTMGAVPADELMTLSVPLCVDHAHLLRQGVVEFDLDSGLH